MYSDFIIKNANIITVNDSMPRARWMAIKDGVICAMGKNDNMPEAKTVYDANGKTIVPGFADTHIHGSLTGEALNAVDVSDCHNKEDLLRKMKECSDYSHQFIEGTLFDRDNWEGELFTAEDLDTISKDQVVLIYDRSYHGCFLNTLGLEEAKVYPGMQGVVVRDGKMTGEINDDVAYYHSISTLMKNLSEDAIFDFMKATEKRAISKGVTTIHSLDGSDMKVDMPAWVIRKNDLRIHVVNYWETMDFDIVEPYKLKQIGGCICLDGSRVIHTMALTKQYCDKPESRGLLYYNDVEVLKFIRTATDKGMQCSMHATGPRAIDQYINLLYQVEKETGEYGLRHRIEHFSLPTEEQIEMAAELNLAIPMQPIFPKYWGEGDNCLYNKLFGRETAAKVEPIADVISAGVTVCGGSDSPVTPIDPLAGMDACVNTDNAHRKIPANEALKVFTKNAAWAAHEENDRGDLSIGKVADFVQLSEDPIKSSSKLKSIIVEKTFIDGELVFEYR